ncbi:unnamed protein product [Toxocara canis]|uniref:Uncharacterized protein n=1 Tax=Toxocara canis TaxID=6265 RepID=A0A183U9Z0_TOXCA|nr:unnamed protein product [Toxocara canis]
MFLRAYSLSLKCRRATLANANWRRFDESSPFFGFTWKTRRSGSLSQKKARGTRSNVIVHEDDSEEPTDSAVVLPSHFHKDGATQRRDDEEAEPSRQRAKKKRLQASLDFPSAVIEMARRASSTKRSSTAVQRSTDSMEIASTEQSSTVGTDDADGRQFGSPHRAAKPGPDS